MLSPSVALPKALDHSMRRFTANRLGILRYLSVVLATPGQRRHALTWLSSCWPGYLLRRPSPWLTFDAINYVETQRPVIQRVFEYGSGGSTLYWARRAATCVSIEHDRHWHRVMLRHVSSCLNIDYRLVLPEPAASEDRIDPADPEAYRSADKGYAGCTFRRYASQVDEFPDAYFDIVLVDGRARPSCILHSVPKVKVGGWMILDNAERAYYLALGRTHLDNFSVHVFQGVGPINTTMWQTNIYVREK